MAEPSCAVRSPGEGVRVLDLPEVLGEAAEAGVEAGYEEATREPAGRVFLNFEGVERMEGPALFLLVRLCTRAEREGRALGAFGLGDRCAAVLAEFGFPEWLDLFSSEAEALARAGVDAAPGPAGRRTGGPCTPDTWAVPLGRARVGEAPEGLLLLNVEGLRAPGPLRGFGPLWERDYRLSLEGVDAGPEEVGRRLREELPRFLPPGNRLRFPPPGVVPGAVGVLELRLPGELPLPTGIRVVYADATSFTFVPLEGGMEASFVHLGVVPGGEAVRVRSLARAGDPLWEAGRTLLGEGAGDRFWRSTLEALGAELGAAGEVAVEKRCLDRHSRWERAGNLTQNAALRTGTAVAGALVGTALLRALGR